MKGGRPTRLAVDYRDIVESLGDIVYEIAADGVLSYASPAVERVLGYRPEELVGRRFRGFLHRDDRDRALEAFGELYNGGDRLARVPAAASGRELPLGPHIEPAPPRR